MERAMLIKSASDFTIQAARAVCTDFFVNGDGVTGCWKYGILPTAAVNLVHLSINYPQATHYRAAEDE
jgi:hypothetical protein